MLARFAVPSLVRPRGIQPSRHRPGRLAGPTLRSAIQRVQYVLNEEPAASVIRGRQERAKLPTDGRTN
ncbi:hypothetical protein BDY21DRAFT_358654, partial [Lineolata rhizophorae]